MSKYITMQSMAPRAIGEVEVWRSKPVRYKILPSAKTRKRLRERVKNILASHPEREGLMDAISPGYRAVQETIPKIRRSEESPSCCAKEK